ncbi:hypothetical protein GGR30_003965 [Martelella radicis]|uniref:Uncharacterized protein n=1 Tax=Martelella radicis TaxID=1397476 RepID=A0A7W6KQB0_9HYPH|nr:hypothetical protein [Martelella radicis]
MQPTRALVHGCFTFDRRCSKAVSIANPIKVAPESKELAYPRGELGAAVGQNSMDDIRHGGDQIAQDLCRIHFCGPGMEFSQSRGSNTTHRAINWNRPIIEFLSFGALG